MAEPPFFPVLVTVFFSDQGFDDNAGRALGNVAIEVQAVGKAIVDGVVADDGSDGGVGGVDGGVGGAGDVVVFDD